MPELSLTNCRIDARYDIQQTLSRGSYAEIYVARDNNAPPGSAHSQVVIKALNATLDPEIDADLERTLIENFENEARALDRVRHPNVISRLGHGAAVDLNGAIFHYLVLEFLAGGDFGKLTRERALEPQKAFAYLEQVCAGLAHAHRNGVIHRDIKPQNILLDADHKIVKIADFGVARLAEALTPVTRVGTNIYAPPEHSPLAGIGVPGQGNLTPAADVYSLAKTAFVLFTRQAPRAFVNQPITYIPAPMAAETWAQPFLEVLKKATQTNPAERYQTVQEFCNALARIHEFIPEDAAPETLVTTRLQLPKAKEAELARSAPRAVDFNTSRELKIKERLGDGPPIVVKLENFDAPKIGLRGQEFAKANASEIISPQPADAETPIFDIPEIVEKEGFFRRNRQMFLVAALLAVFALSLIATHTYLSGRGILPSFSNPFRSTVGVANTDINLRPEPNVSNDPIGLVTKNSKVKIVKTVNNWHEVDVVEQGRSDANTSASHGWIYSKYIDIQK